MPSADRQFMDRKFNPYCLQKREDGTYILLNRDYKPVGVTTPYRVWVDYETWPEAFDIDISPDQAAAMSHNGDDDARRIYFYDDGCKPWEGAKHQRAYHRRVGLFFRMLEADGGHLGTTHADVLHN